MDKVSVIVAIYNIEPYIQRCVDSILASTYTNLEIFLVDDGSKDASGAIIDTYKDERIIVIHKENGGVSSARNIALDQATGDWILFVDGDDYIDKEMIEEMVLNGQGHDIVETTQYFAENNKVYRKSYQTSTAINGIDIHKNKEAVLYLTMAPHSRIYRKDIIGDIRFPLGYVFEDNYFVTMLFPRLTSVKKLDTKYGYYHYKREGSTTLTFNDKIFDMLPIHEQIVAAYQNKKLWKAYHLILEKNALHDLVYSTIGRKFAHYSGEKNIKEEYQKIRTWILKTYPDYKKNPYLSKKEKIVCCWLMKGYFGVKIFHIFVKGSGK